MPNVYIICAAGLGTRMKDVHASVPKPLLLLQGRTLLEHAIECLPVQPEDRVVVVGQRAHRLERCADRLYSRFEKNKIEWVGIDKPTRGQLETAMIAARTALAHESIAIFNADSMFACHDLLSTMLEGHWDGLIPCSKEKGDAWSFCAVENEHVSPMVVTQVTEKVRISNWCSVGFYWFRDAREFLKQANLELQSPAGVEPYVAPLYSRYLKENRKIGALKTDVFKAMGTLAQLNDYWKINLSELQRENANSPFL